MSTTIYSDLLVKRTVNAERRVNQSLSKETITGPRAVLINDFSWLQIINATSQDVILPDATTLSEGWQLVVMADVASAASVNVMSYDVTTPVLLKNILADRAYRFTLINKSAAAGVWQIDFLEEADKLPAQRYAAGFNATSDWTAGSGVFTRTVTAITHAMGTQPEVQVFVGSAPAVLCMADISVATNGDITISVPSAPDCRFAGKMMIM